MTARKLNAARVRELLNCNPATGQLWWKERPGNPSFNAQFAGKLAGKADPSTGYLRLMIDGTHQYVHRMVWLHTKGRLPRSDLDHIDGDKTNCAISNLRVATRTQNNANRRPPSRRTPGPPRFTTESQDRDVRGPDSDRRQRWRPWAANLSGLLSRA